MYRLSIKSSWFRNALFSFEKFTWKYPDIALNGHRFFYAKVSARFSVVTGYKASEIFYKRTRDWLKTNFQDYSGKFSVNHLIFFDDVELVAWFWFWMESLIWALASGPDKPLFWEPQRFLVFFKWQLEVKVIFNFTVTTSRLISTYHWKKENEKVIND